MDVSLLHHTTTLLRRKACFSALISQDALKRKGQRARAPFITRAAHQEVAEIPFVLVR